MAVVLFPPRLLHEKPTRLRGQCGVHSPMLEYSGPEVFYLEGESAHTRGKSRKFQVVRLERSPTGSCHGSFRINEVTKDGLVTHGYHCSYPDFDVCVRVALDSRMLHHIKEISYDSQEEDLDDEAA